MTAVRSLHLAVTLMVISNEPSELGTCVKWWMATSYKHAYKFYV